MSLNIIFMGTPEFSVPILKTINNSNHKILEVYTQPPKKKNRGQKINLSPVHQYSLENKLQVRHPENIDTTDEFEFIKRLNPDLVLVVAYGQIIPSKWLNIENIKFINIHASLLPKWRGAAPIQRAIMNLDKETGISIMKIVEKLDAGPIMMRKSIKILRDTTYEELKRNLSDLGSKMTVEALKLIEKNEDKFFPQIEKEATYAKKIKKEESKINWKNSAEKIIANINALSPNPGAWFEYNGSRIKIIKAEEVKEKGKPGEILKNSFIISCQTNAIQVLEVQKEGKKRMNINEYLKGNFFKIGDFVE